MKETNQFEFEAKKRAEEQRKSLPSPGAERVMVMIFSNILMFQEECLCPNPSFPLYLFLQRVSSLQ